MIIRVITVTGADFVLINTAAVGKAQCRVVFVTNITVVGKCAESGIFSTQVNRGCIGLVITCKTVGITLLIPPVTGQGIVIRESRIAVIKIHPGDRVVSQPVGIALGKNGTDAGFGQYVLRHPADKQRIITGTDTIFLLHQQSSKTGVTYPACQFAADINIHWLAGGRIQAYATRIKRNAVVATGAE